MSLLLLLLVVVVVVAVVAVVAVYNISVNNDITKNNKNTKYNNTTINNEARLVCYLWYVRVCVSRCDCLLCVALVVCCFVALAGWSSPAARAAIEDRDTANLHTEILDFRGFDSCISLMLRDEVIMPKGNLLEILSQRIVVGIQLVGRLGVASSRCSCPLLCCVYSAKEKCRMLHCLERL